MRESCIHRKVCRYARANTECRDGIVVVHIAACDVSECGVTWQAMRYEFGVWRHENPSFCPVCGARVVEE